MARHERSAALDLADRPRNALAQDPLLAEALAGLRRVPKRISPIWFYDVRGSHLFDMICRLPEYYPTRTETAILEQHAGAIAETIGEHAMLVEFGSGASTKTRILLERMRTACAYVPVEISREHLLAAARRIALTWPELEVLPVCADFTRPFPMPRPRRNPARRVVFFPGSTIGNFDRPQAIALMQLMREIAGRDGALLIGVDLLKDPEVLLRAYDDAAGVTAEFNLNALRRFNRELGADFEIDAFSHAAVWNAPEARIEMHLVSRTDQEVRLGAEIIAFAAGEHVVTEHCHKYTLDGFEAMAREAGWAAPRWWPDERRYFGVGLFCRSLM